VDAPPLPPKGVQLRTASLGTTATQPLPESEQDFDLTAEARRLDKIRLIARLVFLAIGAGFALLGLWELLATRVPDSWIVAVIVWGLAAAIFWIALGIRTKPPLQDVRLDANGVTLRFEDGTAQEMGWEDPQFGLTLRDYSPDPLTTKGGKAHVWLLMPGNRTGTVPHDVAEAIVRDARGHSLPVLERREVVSAGRSSHVTLTTRIGRPELTPRWRGH
jgi:hypothetical protein